MVGKRLTGPGGEKWVGNNLKYLGKRVIIGVGNLGRDLND
jgi:UDP-N-acetyl-D-mannosaminuronic acid transferase (WecB/TagA/CpsF family)